MTKPPYCVPSLAEIAKTRGTNGLKCISTFAGGGGSSCGYEMAGYDVVWANEYNAHAAECHRLNFPDCILDTRDIREVTSAEVLTATGTAPGELDVLDGSPPCQGFSMSGKRQVSDLRNTLFWEFARLLEELQPRAFIAENVAGMAAGVMKGVFKEVLAKLKSCGYVVEARIVDAQWLGVPQTRRRLIFVGMRADTGLTPTFPTPLAYRYSVRDALPLSQDVKHRLGGFGPPTPCMNRPSPAITATQCRVTCREHGEAARRNLDISGIKRICAFPDDFQLTGSYAQQWAVLGNSVPPVMMRHIAGAVADTLTQAQPPPQ